MQRLVGQDFIILKTDASSSVTWAGIFGGTSTDGALSITQRTDESYIASGYRFGANNDAVILRLDANGNYPGCVSAYPPATSSPTFTVNSPSGLLACSSPD
ncbi:MAG: hypothetical protein ACP5QG_06375 [candidate division WOR-3 bacterium]